MEKECEERLTKIRAGFQECRNAFTAIGDETRQGILLTLLESDLSGIRVGNQCTHCMACICRCPSEAIEYGKHSIGKPRYVCPELS